MKDLGIRGKLVVVLLALTSMLGCGALDASQPSAQKTTGLVATSPMLDFGTVEVGATQVRSNTIVNRTSSPIVLTGAQIDQTDFTITGQKLPLTLAPGQRAMVQIVYSPQTSGTSQGTVVLAGNVIRPFTTFGLRGIAIMSGRIKVTPASVGFGNVQAGQAQSQTVTLSNPGRGTVTVTRAVISGQGFALTGLNLPLTLAAGQSTAMGVTFAPTSSGAAKGTIALTGTISVIKPKRPTQIIRGSEGLSASNTVSSTVNVPVSGNGMASGQLAISPPSLAMGTVKIGASQTQSATLINSGGSTVTVKQATVTGKGFAMSGLSFPLTLAAGQRKSFNVTFAPQAVGSASGSIAVTSDAPNPVVSVPVSALATAPGALVSNPSSLNFGNVQMGGPQTIAETVTNSGGSSITLTQANISGAGFSLSGLTLPLALAAGQSTTFNVIFTPQAGGAASGSLTIASNASNGTLSIPLAANSATGGVLSTSDSSLTFGNVAVGGSATQSETLTNSGGSSVTISAANLSGAAFRVTGLSLPMTLNPGQSFTFGTVFSPTSGGSATGSISVISNASNSTVTISLAGTATVSGQLAVSPATLSFGNVVVGQTKSLTGTLTASGSSITVSDAGMSTSEFTVTGLSLPLTLSDGQSKSFTVVFKPQSSGAAAASVSFTSNASNSSAAQTLTGSGTAAPQHSVALSWTPSVSSVVGYNVYRGTTTGGPYSKIGAMNADTSYVDSSVQGGQTYFYVTTAVDAAGKESGNSNQTQAVIPSP